MDQEIELKHFLNKTLSSQDILTSDFGTFPPNPLISNTRYNNTVMLLSSRSCKRFFTRMSALTGMIKNLIKNSNKSIMKELLLMLKEEDRAFEEYLSMRRTFKTLKEDSQVKYAIVKSLFVPMAIIAFFYFKYQTIKKRKKNTNVASVFSHDKAAYIFFTKKNILQSPSINIRNILAHENIHIIQTQNSKFNSIELLRKRNKLSKKIRSGYFYDGEKFFDRIHYYFQDVELEAYLHVALTDIYRFTQKIPTCRKTFVGLFYIYLSSFNTDEITFLLPEKTYGSFFESLLKFSQENLENIRIVKGCITKKDRATVIAFSNILLYLADYNILDFICNKLCSIYANLLDYYGDNKLSTKIREETISYQYNQEDDQYFLCSN